MGEDVRIEVDTVLSVTDSDSETKLEKVDQISVELNFMHEESVRLEKKNSSIDEEEGDWKRD